MKNLTVIAAMTLAFSSISHAVEMTAHFGGNASQCYQPPLEFNDFPTDKIAIQELYLSKEAMKPIYYDCNQISPYILIHKVELIGNETCLSTHVTADFRCSISW